MMSSRSLIRFPTEVENLPMRVTGVQRIVDPFEEQR